MSKQYPYVSLLNSLGGSEGRVYVVDMNQVIKIKSTDQNQLIEKC